MRKFAILFFLLAAVVAGAGVQFGGSTYGYNSIGAVKTDPTDMTVACWFRRSDSMVPGDWLCGITFNSANDQVGIAFAATNILFMQVFSTSMGAGRQALYTNTIPAGVWRHVAGTIQSSGVTLWLDGQPVATNTTAWTMNSGVGTSGTVQMAGILYGGTVYSYFLGDLAEAVIYDRVLTRGEIAGLAAGQSPLTMPASLVYYDSLVATNGWNMVRGPRTTWSGTIPTPTSHPKSYKP